MRGIHANGSNPEQINAAHTYFVYFCNADLMMGLY
jgi:hypothetical protein